MTKPRLRWAAGMPHSPLFSYTPGQYVLCYRGQGINYEQYPSTLGALMLTAKDPTTVAVGLGWAVVVSSKNTMTVAGMNVATLRPILNASHPEMFFALLGRGWKHTCLSIDGLTHSHCRHRCRHIRLVLGQGRVWGREMPPDLPAFCDQHAERLYSIGAAQFDLHCVHVSQRQHITGLLRPAAGPSRVLLWCVERSQGCQPCHV